MTSTETGIWQGLFGFTFRAGSVTDFLFSVFLVDSVLPIAQ